MLWLLQWKPHIHEAFYLRYINHLRDWATPEFWVANTSTPILLNYYLVKSVFHPCYQRPNVGDAGAALPWLVLCSEALKFASSSCLAWWLLILLLRSPCPWILKSCTEVARSCQNTTSRIFGSFLSTKHNKWRSAKSDVGNQCPTALPTLWWVVCTHFPNITCSRKHQL